MYGKHNAVRDGCMALALALDLLANSNRTITKEMQKIPQTYTTKDKISCTRVQARKIISTLKKEHKNFDTTDGIKIIFDEKNWVMIRPSGTEPIARIYAEADSQQRLEQIMSRYLKKVKSMLGN